MVLFGIAAILTALAALTAAAAFLLKVLGVKLKEPERELTEEEKQALTAQIEANHKWSAACDSLVFGVMPYGGEHL